VFTAQQAAIKRSIEEVKRRMLSVQEVHDRLASQNTRLDTLRDARSEYQTLKTQLKPLIENDATIPEPLVAARNAAVAKRTALETAFREEERALRQALVAGGLLA